MRRITSLNRLALPIRTPNLRARLAPTRSIPRDQRERRPRGVANIVVRERPADAVVEADGPAEIRAALRELYGVAEFLRLEGTRPCCAGLDF